MIPPSPDAGLYAAARRVLLDALEALEDHLDALILVGAQAMYLHAGDSSTITDPPYTTDGDLGIDPSKLGTWEKLVPASAVGAMAQDAIVAVDLLVPEAVSGAGRRGARLGPHGKDVAAKSPGLEAVLVDHSVHRIAALAADDAREYELQVAGPAALLVAKVHKVADRIGDADRGRVDRLRGGKDLLDIVRLYESRSPAEIASTLHMCRADAVAAPATENAIAALHAWVDSDTGVAASYIPQQSTTTTENLRTYFIRYTEALLHELRSAS